MAKRRTKRAEHRAKKKAEKERSMKHPSGRSRYGRKNRHQEIARGYSKRETSPFYLSPHQVASARGVTVAEVEAEYAEEAAEVA